MNKYLEFEELPEVELLTELGGVADGTHEAGEGKGGGKQEDGTGYTNTMNNKDNTHSNMTTIKNNTLYLGPLFRALKAQCKYFSCDK